MKNTEILILLVLGIYRTLKLFKKSGQKAGISVLDLGLILIPQRIDKDNSKYEFKDLDKLVFF